MPASILDLPDEILINIFQNLSPYADLKNCATISKQWATEVEKVQRITHKNFIKSLLDFKIKWVDIPLETVAPTNALEGTSLDGNATTGPIISERFSHATCVHDDIMYVYAGVMEPKKPVLHSELWSLDLNTRLWTSPSATGPYPTPRGYASLVAYNNRLYVFGGWCSIHPALTPIGYECRDPTKISNEFYEYNIETKEWRKLNKPGDDDDMMMLDSDDIPPKVFKHSVSMHGTNMIIFGGVKKRLMNAYAETDEVWSYNFSTDIWRRKLTSIPSPCPRYGQWQIALDNTHLLIIGGSGRGDQHFNDIWLLDMSVNNKVWQWTQLDIIGVENGPEHIWFISGLKVDQYVVTFTKCQAADDPTHPELECAMSLYILDTTEALTHKRVTWLPYKTNYGPNLMTLYSLEAGTNELIMFGGFQLRQKNLGVIQNNLISITIADPPKD